MPRFGVVEADGKNQLLEFFRRELVEIARLFDDLEKPVANFGCCFVLRAGAQDCGHEDEEWIFRLRLYEIHDGRIVRLVFLLQKTIHRRYFGYVHLHPLGDSAPMIKKVLQGVMFHVGWNGMVGMEDVTASSFEKRYEFAIQFVINLL